MRDLAPKGTPTEMFMMEIDGPKLRQDTLEIEPLTGESIYLPIWTIGSDWNATVFVEYLGVNPRLSQVSEWLALDHIPLSMIGTTWQ